MKKILLMLAAATLAFAACEKPNNDDPTPGVEVCPDCGKNPCECASETELFLTVPVKLQHEITTNYGGTIVSLDGDKILKFFDMTEEEFYTAMGSLDDNKAQVNNTILFGFCYQDGGEWVYEFIPSTSANFGHWVSKDGMYTEWHAEAAPSYYFTEWKLFWGEGTYEEALAATNEYFQPEVPYTMWDLTFGMDPCFYEGKVGDKASFTEFFFEQSTQKTCYVTYELEIVDYVDPELGQYPADATAGTFDIDVPLTFSLAGQSYEYEGVSFTSEFETVKEKLGMTTYELSQAIAAGEVVLTYTLPDGTTGNGANVWLNASNAVTSWGAEDAAVCLEWFYGSTPESLYGHTCAMPSYYDPAPEEGPAYYYSDAVKAAIGKPIKATFTITYGDTVINLNCTTTLAE